MKIATTILLSAASLAVLADLLFHDSIFHSVPWGLSVLAWVSTIVLAAALLARRFKPRSSWGSLWFTAPSIVLAIACCWRDSSILRWLDICLIAFFLFAASMSMRGVRMLVSGLTKYLLIPVQAIESLVAKPLELL